MSLLSGLLSDAKQLKDTLVEVLNLQQLTMERMNQMSEKADQLKSQIAEIGTDLTEIDGDLDEVIAKVDAVTSLPTEAEWEEISQMLTGLKTKTAATAAKVPEPAPPTP